MCTSTASRAKTQVLLDTLYRPFRNAGKRVQEPFRIGAGWGPERRFRGQIDEVRVYSRVLNEDEIAALALGESIDEIARKPDAAALARSRNFSCTRITWKTPRRRMFASRRSNSPRCARRRKSSSAASPP